MSHKLEVYEKWRVECRRNALAFNIKAYEMERKANEVNPTNVDEVNRWQRASTRHRAQKYEELLAYEQTTQRKEGVE